MITFVHHVNVVDCMGIEPTLRACLQNTAHVLAESSGLEPQTREGPIRLANDASP